VDSEQFACVEAVQRKKLRQPEYSPAPSRFGHEPEKKPKTVWLFVRREGTLNGRAALIFSQDSWNYSSGVERT
jgi:hypothetical protein